MARIGEGDSRWIVEDLGSSGRNVSGWHWEEKNVTSWAHAWLKNGLVNLELLGDSGGSSSVRITQVSKLEGDVVYCNRKGKNLFFFDLTLKLVWKGTDASGTPVSGELELLELQQDTKLEELEYSVSATDSASDATKQLVRTKGIVAVREKLREFLAALAAQYSEIRTVSPARASPTEERTTAPAAAATAAPAAAAAAAPAKSSSTPSSASASSGGVATQSYKSVIEFAASPSDIFQCLTDRARVSVYTQSAADVSPENGASFSLFNNSITGTNTKMVPNETIIQQWRFQDWPANHYSKLSISIEPITSGARLTLDHRGIPSDDYERTRAGWRTHFWERIRIVFGYNFKVVK